MKLVIEFRHCDMEDFTVRVIICINTLVTWDVFLLLNDFNLIK